MNNYKIFINIITLIIAYYIYITFAKALIYFITHDIKYVGLFSSIYIYNEIFIEGDYNCIKPKNNWTIFDIGGNIGLYTLYLNDNYSDLKIHVFEPIKELHKKLVHNVNVNKKNNNKIITNNVGVGDITSNLTINFFPNADGLSTLNNDIEEKTKKIIESKCKNTNILSYFCESFYSTVLKKSLTNVKQNISIIKMTDYIKQHNIKKINLVKIDVEGFEYNVINGLSSEDFKIIDNFIIEVENYNGCNLSNITSLLQKNNFIVYNLTPGKLWTTICAQKI